MKSRVKREINDGAITNLQRLFCTSKNSKTENRNIRISVIGVLRSDNDVWGAVDRMDALITTRTLLGSRVEIPARPRGVERAKELDAARVMCDENLDFVVVNSALENGVADSMPDALPVEKSRWWLQSRYLWYAIERASRVLGVEASFPKEQNVVFDGSAEFFWSVMDIAEKFFRQHVPNYAIGGLYVEPLGVILLFKGARNALKIHYAGRALLTDVGRQFYEKSVTKQRIVIKKGAVLKIETYSDELSVPQMLNNLKPVLLFSSAKINAKLHEIMPLQTGSLRDGKTIRATRDIEIGGLVYQWNTSQADSPLHSSREMYHAIDYSFQNPTSTFLFTGDAPNSLSTPKGRERQQETFIIDDSMEFMLSLSSVELVNVGALELAGQVENSAFELV